MRKTEYQGPERARLRETEKVRRETHTRERERKKERARDKGTNCQRKDRKTESTETANRRRGNQNLDERSKKNLWHKKNKNKSSCRQGHAHDPLNTSKKGTFRTYILPLGREPCLVLSKIRKQKPELSPSQTSNIQNCGVSQGGGASRVTCELGIQAGPAKLATRECCKAHHQPDRLGNLSGRGPEEPQGRPGHWAYNRRHLIPHRLGNRTLPELVQTRPSVRDGGPTGTRAWNVGTPDAINP